MKKKSEVLEVRMSIIEAIRIGELDRLYYLKSLKLEANHRLKYIEPGVFRNLSNLQALSISYSTALHTIYDTTFRGLTNLRNLTMVNNGFTNFLELTPALRPSILPSLESLDLSENIFETIPEKAFVLLNGTRLRRLGMNLCQIDYIHPNGFLPLKMLKELNIGENDLNSSMIEEFLGSMIDKGINLYYLDLTGLTFRKHPPKKLLQVIANSTIRTLILAKNQFEMILDHSFPPMKNINVLDLRKVSAVYIGPNAFEPRKFPALQALFLSGNNLPGIHEGHISSQIKLLDLSYNTMNTINPTYFEIDSDTFADCNELEILNLAFNRIKAIFDYTFRGLNKLKFLNLENGTLYYIGPGTFKYTPNLKILNLANNPLTANENFTKRQFEGLSELNVLIMKNCGIKFFCDKENIFEMMPNITKLILRNNLLYFITPKLLHPMEKLSVLDLSENFLTAWSMPLFYGTKLLPQKIYMTNNKISHFSISMLEDIDYLIQNHSNGTDIDLMGNVFVCDCNAMYATYTWIEANASYALKQFFVNSKFQCSTPDLWEDRRVVEYLRSVKGLTCIMYDKISNAMLFVWSTPTIVMILFCGVLIAIAFKFRIYINYWLFLAKLALGRKFIRNTERAQDKAVVKVYKYDAFISYCNDDREFVLEMISQLENNPPFLHLCVYERDFEIGSFISESILNSINESKYIVLVVSNGFAKSQWCRWETQLAEYHRLFLEDGTVYDPLVLIRIGGIESKYLTTTLKYLLKTKIYLSWDEHHCDEFWKKLRNVLVRR